VVWGLPEEGLAWVAWELRPECEMFSLAWPEVWPLDLELFIDNFKF